MKEDMNNNYTQAVSKGALLHCALFTYPNRIVPAPGGHRQTRLRTFVTKAVSTSPAVMFGLRGLEAC